MSNIWKITKCSKAIKGSNDDLPDLLQLAPSARVMLTRHIDTADGAFGTVTHIKNDTNKGSPKVYLLYDNERIGKHQKPHTSQKAHQPQFLCPCMRTKKINAYQK
jgi:hypothetical protein